MSLYAPELLYFFIDWNKLLSIVTKLNIYVSIKQPIMTLEYENSNVTIQIDNMIQYFYSNCKTNLT